MKNEKHYLDGNLTTRNRLVIYTWILDVWITEIIHLNEDVWRRSVWWSWRWFRSGKVRARRVSSRMLRVWQMESHEKKPH